MANKKKKNVVSLPESEEVLQGQVGQVEKIETDETKKIPRKRAEKPIVPKQPKESKDGIKVENKSEVATTRTGKIIRLFGDNTAMIEIDNVKSLISLGNSKRYKVGDVIQL